MPTYTFKCQKCNITFELFATYAQYDQLEKKCPACKSKNTDRCFLDDVSTISGSVRKADSELSTIGDLANRNRDKFSDDEKRHLHNKHNSYKDSSFIDSKLKTGMTRMKK